MLSIARYIGEDLFNPQIARELLKRLLESIKTLDGLPMRSPLCEDKKWRAIGLRFLTVNNYLVFYLPDEETRVVKIYRIICYKRDIKNQLKENNIMN